MATLWIREYNKRSAAPIAEEPGTDQAPLTFSTTAASAAFATGTTMITMISSAAFHYVVGTAPTATTGALKIPADTPYTIGVKAGQKVAAIAAA